MSAQPVPPLIVGSVPLATVRNSLRLSYGGGVSNLHRMLTQRVIGVKNPPSIVSVDVGVYPLQAADAPTLDALLAIEDVLPLILPDGTRLAVEMEQHEVRGYYEQGTAQYNTSWRVRHDVLLADLFWRAPIGTGIVAPNTQTPYQVAGAVQVQRDTGAQLTGAGAWAQTYLAEAQGGNWPLPILIAEFSVAANTTAAIGLARPVAQRAARPFGSDGVGVRFSPTAVAALDQTDTPHSSVNVASTTGRWRLIVAGRPRGARVELWQGATRYLYNPSLPLAAGSLGAIVSVQSGSLTLHWWMVRQG